MFLHLTPIVGHLLSISLNTQATCYFYFKLRQNIYVLLTTVLQLETMTRA